jgi:hemerythrin-like domain-containing protein
MDVKQILQPFFENTALFLSGPGLVAATMARLIHVALTEVSFDPARAVDQLSKLGFKVGQALLPELMEAAKNGVKSLTQWFEAKLTTSTEANEATSRTLVEQAEAITTAVQEGLPNEKKEVAETMKKGLQAYGGATAEIAETYAAVLLDPNQLQKFVAEMQRKIDTWARQSIEAKQGSLIENVEQTIEGGSGGQQEIRAEDNSIISGVKQTIRGSEEE